MDLTGTVKIIKQYFETTLNTTAFQLEIEDSKKEQGIWTIVVTLRPYFGSGKRYEFRIEDESGDILNATTKGQASSFGT